MKPSIHLVLCSILLLFACDSKNNNGNALRENNDFGFAENYQNTDRDIWQKPDLVLNLMGDVSNKAVADIGAGNGFFTFRLGEKAKKVVALEIDESLVDTIAANIPMNLKEKIEARLAEADDPMLEKDEVDIVLIVNTYMYLEDRLKYLNTLQEGLTPNGKILIVDFKKKETQVGPDTEVRVPLYLVEKEFREAGYRVILSDDTSLEYQYIALAQCNGNC